MFTNLKKFWRDEAGPTAVEYAIMVAGIAVVIVATVFLLGTQVNTTFNNVKGHLPSGS